MASWIVHFKTETKEEFVKHSLSLNPSTIHIVVRTISFGVCYLRTCRPPTASTWLRSTKVSSIYE